MKWAMLTAMNSHMFTPAHNYWWKQTNITEGSKCLLWFCSGWTRIKIWTMNIQADNMI